MRFLKSNRFAGGIARMWLLPMQNYKGLIFDPESGMFQPEGIKNYLTEVPFSIDSGSWQVKKKKMFYQVEISTFITGAGINNLEASIDLERTPFLVIIQDYNGNFLLFGDHSNYFLYDPDIAGSNDFSTPAGINFTLKRSMMSLPVFLSDIFLNAAPIASNVSIQGDLFPGNTVIGQYTFIDEDGNDEGDSSFAWYLSDDFSGTNESQITGETEQSITLTESMVDKYIRFGVKPNDGIEFGNEVFSSRIKVEEYVDQPPEAIGLSISGDVESKGVVTGNYTYYDEDGDQEYDSIHRFYIEDESGINRGLIHESFGVETDDISMQLDYHGGSYLIFSVTPNNAKQRGQETFSNRVYISKVWHDYDLTTADFDVYYREPDNYDDLSFRLAQGLAVPEKFLLWHIVKTTDQNEFNIQVQSDLNLDVDRVKFHVDIQYGIHDSYPEDVFTRSPYFEIGIQYGVQQTEKAVFLTKPTWPVQSEKIIGDYSTYPQPIPFFNEDTQEYENSPLEDYSIEIERPYLYAKKGRIFFKIYSKGEFEFGRSDIFLGISYVKFFR